MRGTKYNPYFPYGMNPFMQMPGQPLKTPEQYRADILRQLAPQFDNYNSMYEQAQKQQTIRDNSGSYIKVSSYEEVKNVDAPSDGKPIIIIDEVNGVLYSKKFDNGQQYIKGFSLVPLESKEEETTKVEEKKVETKEDKASLDLILEKLTSLDERLVKLEGVKADVNPTDATK